MLNVALKFFHKDVVTRPPMLSVISSRLSTQVKTSLVDCSTWLQLNTSGLQRTRKASSKQPI